MGTSAIHRLSKRKYLFACALLLLASIGFAAFRFSGNDEFVRARQQIVFREIGHKILLASGDSTSRVLPVTEIAAGKYRIQFENHFTFQTDSLVRIITQALEREGQSQEYIVNVLDCTGKDVLFGYAISGNGRQNIIPCSGRKQPKACYLVTIGYKDSGMAALSKGYIVGGASLFAFVGLLAFRPFKRKMNPQPVQDGEGGRAGAKGIRLGNTWFNADKREIHIDGVTTELTPKEAKLLCILAATPNEVIERARIQKEIWEDEGVIVGRSLDMFVSRLRKKLEKDESVQLVNIHGKGYKLQTGSIDDKA